MPDNLLAFFVDFIIPSIGIGTLIVAIITYHRNQIIKRADVIFPLITEFDNSEKMFFAKKILDNFHIRVTNQGPNWHKGDLSVILRIPSTDESYSYSDDQIKIRESFDALLDFLCKLDYLIKINLITKNELSYFNYYVDRLVNEPSIIKYLKNFNFPLYGRLNTNLNIEDL